MCKQEPLRWEGEEVPAETKGPGKPPPTITEQQAHDIERFLCGMNPGC